MKKDQLFKYFLRATSTAEDAEVRQWVEASDDNRVKFMEERKIFDIASLMDLDCEVGESAVSDVRASGSDVNTPVGAGTPGRWRRVLRSVAAAAVIAVAAVWGYERFIAPSSVTEYPVGMQALEIPAGQRLKVMLSDGSSVWLNSNTRMEFPGVFDKDSRIVSIDGEAYFEVSKDSTRPFVVNTPGGRVKVTGTKFNVDDYSANPGMSVSLIEGSVEVSAAGATHKLTQGTRLDVSEGEATQSMLRTEDVEWINGIVSFRQKQLPEILQRFEKYYGMKVEYPHGKMSDTRFSGRFYIEEGIEQALQTLQCDVDFTYTIDKDHRRVTIQ